MTKQRHHTPEPDDVDAGSPLPELAELRVDTDSDFVFLVLRRIDEKHFKMNLLQVAFYLPWVFVRELLHGCLTVFDDGKPSRGGR